MTVPAPAKLLRVLAIIAAIGFLYSATLWKLGVDWSTDQNYSHGLLVPFIIGYIIWAERASLKSSAGDGYVYLGAAAIVFALIVLWAGTAGAELFVQRFSLVIMLLGIVVYFWGLTILRILLVPVLLLLLAIPIPAILFNKIAFPLQLFASRCAVWAMRLFDIPVLRQGNIIELKPRNSVGTTKLEVVEACSGIRSLMTLMALALVMAYFTRPGKGRGDSDPGGPGSGSKSFGIFRSVIIVAAAVPIAILTNALRVSGTGILAHYYGTKVADGFFHSFSGWVVYIAAFILLFGVVWLIDRFEPKSNDGPKGGSGDGAVQRVMTGTVPPAGGHLASTKGAE
jgi:exosortase